MLRKGVKLLIKKMVDYKKALVAILENTLENVNAGNTNITEEEASVIIDHLTMLNKGVATVSKAYACEHVLHITSYIQIDTQLKQLVQEALINSVKSVIEQSQVGKDLLTQQLNYVKSSKNAIIAESNKKLELFEKFQIAASANPNLTYKEFCESINK